MEINYGNRKYNENNEKIDIQFLKHYEKFLKENNIRLYKQSIDQSTKIEYWNESIRNNRKKRNNLFPKNSYTLEETITINYSK